jgi:hypothetical protein
MDRWRDGQMDKLNNEGGTVGHKDSRANGQMDRQTYK